MYLKWNLPIMRITYSMIYKERRMSANNIISLQIYDLAKKLWAINRSITGDGVRETLSIIREEIPDLKIFEVPSGTQGQHR